MEVGGDGGEKRSGGLISDSQLMVLLVVVFARPLLACVSRQGISKYWRAKPARERRARQEPSDASARRLHVIEGSCMMRDDDVESKNKHQLREG